MPTTFSPQRNSHAAAVAPVRNFTRPFFSRLITFVLVAGIAWVLTFLFLIDAAGQLTPKYVVDSKADAACELNSRYIDSLVYDMKENQALVYIIAKRNVKEKELVNRARLSSAVSILNQVKGVKAEQIITGVGDAVSGSKGRLEFYFDNELFLVSYAEPGKHACLACCPEGIFLPTKKPSSSSKASAGRGY